MIPHTISVELVKQMLMFYHFQFWHILCNLLQKEYVECNWFEWE